MITMIKDDSPRDMLNNNTLLFEDNLLKHLTY